MIDPVSLRALVAVADNGSVTAAADVLGYTPPNITQHLRKLERTLNTPIVERAGRGIVLTPVAHTIVDRARTIIDDLDRLVVETTASSEPAGTLRVAAFPTALRSLLLPAMAVARDRHPQLSIVPSERKEAPLRELSIGRYDAVLAKTWGQTRLQPVPTRPLERVHIGRERLVAILPRSHRLASSAPIRLASLVGEQWAILLDDGPFSEWIGTHDPTSTDLLTHAYEAVEFATLIRFVEFGLAVTVLPEPAAAELPEGAVAVPLADADAYRDIHLYTRPSLAGSPALRALLDLLRAHAAT